jgi:DNA-binding protein H-NS
MATKTLGQIQRQIANLQREAEELKKQEVIEVIAKIKEAIDVYGLTAAMLGFKNLYGPRRGAKGRSKVAVERAAMATRAKYMDKSGNTWVGRGPRPAWLREALASGRQLEEFLA